MKKYYDKITKCISFEANENTIEWEDDLLADYREYAGNLNDKSLEIAYKDDGTPYLNRYELNSKGERYSLYKTRKSKGIFVPNLEAIQAEQTQQKLLSDIAAAKKQRDELMLAGAIYLLNTIEYKVSFTKDDGDGLVQVKSAFELGLSETIIYFENGTRMPIKATEFSEFALWFVEKRNEFFV